MIDSAKGQAKPLGVNKPTYEEHLGIALGVDYARLPGFIRHRFDEAPGIFLGMMMLNYKRFSLNLHISTSWMRSKDEFENNGVAWPQRSTSAIMDISAVFGYEFWFFHSLQIKPTVGIGNTQVVLWDQQDSVRYTVLNMPLALNLAYFPQALGRSQSGRGFAHLLYAIIFRLSYAYWSGASGGSLLDSGVWHASLGLGIFVIDFK